MNKNGIAMQSQMKSSTCLTRASMTANLIAIATIAIALIAVACEAMAHHPGSHASRKAGKLVVEAVAVTNDDCTKALSVEAGAPANVGALANDVFVTLRLENSPGSDCNKQAGLVSATGVIPDVIGAAYVHLYVVDQSNKLLSTERVPIR